LISKGKNAQKYINGEKSSTRSKNMKAKNVGRRMASMRIFTSV
jgi:hypothetical protein